MNRANTGIIFVLIFIVSVSIRDIVASGMLQSINLFVYSFIFSLILNIVFFTLYISINGIYKVSSDFKNSYKSLAFLNISTTINWLCAFFALKFLEPAIVNAIVSMIGPFGLTLLLFFKKEQISKNDAVSSFLILMLLVYLVSISFLNKSGVQAGARESLVGICLAIISGFGAIMNIVYSKTLNIAGKKISFVLGGRFFLLTTTTFIVGFYTVDNFLFEIKENFLLITQMALIFGVIPIYCLQKGIAKLRSFTVSLLLVSIPVLTFFFQIFNARIGFSYHTLVGIFLTTVIMLLTITLGGKKMNGGSDRT